MKIDLHPLASSEPESFNRGRDDHAADYRKRG
jgi:hypothetical protein